MSDILGNFIEKKKAESAFITLTDGETIIVKELKSIKLVTKLGFAGKEQEVLHLTCLVDTSEGDREKSFDNGTQRFAKELQDKGVKVGCGFSLTREGEQTKTRYTVSAVISDESPQATIPTATPASAPATSSPAPVETPKA